MNEQLYDVIVIGSGPAGYTASIYTARANLRTLIVTGLEVGGQLMLTRDVENYPGFPEAVLGPDLMEKMRVQAEKMGVEMIYESATAVDFKSYPFKVYTDQEEYAALTVIVSTGASPKWLGLESEKRLVGRGVSSCATCDGPLFKGARNVVVVGGGDTAMEYTLFLSNLASRVTVVHRRDRLRASKVLQERAFAKPNVQFIWNSVVEEILGSERVKGVRVRNVQTGVEENVDCEAVFVSIGHKPNTDIFIGQLELDEAGYIKLYDGMQTSVKGVFAAGDVHDHRYRQAVTAAGFGCMAGMEAISFIQEGGPESLTKTVQEVRI